MSVNFEEIVLAPKLRVKSERAHTCTDISELLASTKSKSHSHPTAFSLNNLAQEVGDFTYQDILAFRHIEEVLKRERSIRQNYERELTKIKNNMERIIHSNLPMHIKVIQMESMSETLQTHLNCMRENNKDAKERILRLERINSYMTALTLLNNWASKNGNIGEELTTTINLTLNGSSFMADIKQQRDSIGSTGSKGKDENQEGLMATENEAALKNKLEAVVILLKQAAIPFVIALENTKDDFNDVQNQVKQRKLILEERLRLVEELKQKVVKNDFVVNDKENVNPNMKKNSNNKTKLRDVYLDFEEKTLEMSMSRVNTTTNLSVLQEASSKISSAFGRLFKGKKENRVPEKIFTAEVLQDLGLQSTSRR